MQTSRKMKCIANALWILASVAALFIGYVLPPDLRDPLDTRYLIYGVIAWSIIALIATRFEKAALFHKTIETYSSQQSKTENNA